MRAIPLAILLLAAGCVNAAVGDDPGADAAVPEPEDEGEEPGEEVDDLDGVDAPGELRPGCTARGRLGGHTVWMHFTRPNAPCTPDGAGTPGIDTHILKELVRLIDSVPAGGRIDGHIFNITVDGVAKALLNAQQRGVRVEISTDRRVGESTDSARTYLDQLDHHVYCGTATTGSCIGAAADSISHTKLFVFSTATAPDGAVHQDVSWFGSANQTQASGTKVFNNTVTVYGDATLYDRFRGYLADLFAQRRRTDYYDPGSGRGHILAAAADAYISPETTTDLVVNRLDDITPDADCRVRVMQASIRDSRLAVVDHLVSMKNRGCKVWVVASTIEPTARARLRAAGIAMRRHHVHDKAFVVRGRYGDVLRYRVYTGSHNLSGSANRKYDELFVKLAGEAEASRPVYDAYYRHFNDAYDDGDPF